LAQCGAAQACRRRAWGPEIFDAEENQEVKSSWRRTLGANSYSVCVFLALLIMLDLLLTANHQYADRCLGTPRTVLVFALAKMFAGLLVPWIFRTKSVSRKALINWAPWRSRSSLCDDCGFAAMAHWPFPMGWTFLSHNALYYADLAQLRPFRRTFSLIMTACYRSPCLRQSFL